MGLLPTPAGTGSEGEVRFDGQVLTTMSRDAA